MSNPSEAIGTPPAAADGALGLGGPRSAAATAEWIVTRIASLRRVDRARISPDDGLDSFGFSSAERILLAAELSDWIGREVDPRVLWRYPTIAAVARHLGS